MTTMITADTMDPQGIRKEDLNLFPDYHDTVFDGATFFPIFGTADIPPSTFDHLLSSSRPPLQDADGNAGFAILTTVDPNVLFLSGSREPTKPFKSPFLGCTIEEIHAIFRGSSPGLNRNVPAKWSSRIFVVLDAATLSGPPTALVALDCSGTLETIRCDFPTALRFAYCIDGDVLNIAYTRAQLVDVDGIVTHDLWETLNRNLTTKKRDVVEIEVDRNGERWIELVDANLGRLGVVMKEIDVGKGKGLSLWKSKDEVEGLMSVPPGQIVNGLSENDANIINGKSNNKIIEKL